MTWFLIYTVGALATLVAVWLLEGNFLSRYYEQDSLGRIILVALWPFWLLVCLIKRIIDV
jgi:hypothetical protein